MITAEAFANACYQAAKVALKEFADGHVLDRTRYMFVQLYWEQRRRTIGNPLVLKGEKFFSQNDEDGITLEILRRMGIGRGTFVEFGVGNGLENNSLILLAHGWRGGWVGGEDLAFPLPPGKRRLEFAKAWVTAENCLQLFEQVAPQAAGKGVDLLSVDLDGNDLHVLSALLQGGVTPKVVIVEYNAKFPPPVTWSIKYDPGHRWKGGDYFGASFQSFIELLARHRIRPLCCNVTGTNAFFCSDEYGERFQDVSREPAELFVRADSNWWPGSMPSPATVASLLAD